MRRYSIEQRTRKVYGLNIWIYVISRKYKRRLLNTGLDSLKTASKKVVHKAGGFLENKTADAVAKSNYDKIVEQESVEEIIIPLEKRDEILDRLKNIL